MKQLRVAINGFGRIGRLFFRQAFEDPSIKIVGINDLGEGDNLAYLLKYDSVYGRFNHNVSFKGGKLIVDRQQFPVFQVPEPAKLPWKRVHADVVVESTGVFETKEKASGHLIGGAKHVVITTAAKGDEPVPHLLPGTSEEGFKKLTEHITSNASCTTNAIVPVLEVMRKSPGIKVAVLSTTHAVTSTQSIVDGPCAKDWRRGRAAFSNLAISTTNAAKAAAKVIPEFKDRFDGVSIRVPIITGSLADITFISKKKTTVAAVNGAFKRAAASPRWKGMLKVAEDQIVSTDIVGDKHLCVIDPSGTMVVGGNLVKVMAWYDNEYGYAFSLLEHVKRVGKRL